MSELFGEAWQPKARLRHLLGVVIRRFSARGAVPGTSAYFQLYLLQQQEDGSSVELLLYTSEKALVDLDMYWDCLQLHNLVAADSAVNAHAPFSGQLKLVVRLSPGTSAEPADVDVCGMPGLQCPWAHGRQQSLLEHSHTQTLGQLPQQALQLGGPDDAHKASVAEGDEQRQAQQQQHELSAQQQCSPELQAQQLVPDAHGVPQQPNHALASMLPPEAAAAAVASDADIAGPSTSDALSSMAHSSAGETNMLEACSDQPLVHIVLTAEGQLALQLVGPAAQQQRHSFDAEHSLDELPEHYSTYSRAALLSGSAAVSQGEPGGQEEQCKQQQEAANVVQQVQLNQHPSDEGFDGGVSEPQQQPEQQQWQQQQQHQSQALEQQDAAQHDQHTKQAAAALKHEPPAPAAAASSDPAVMKFVFCMDTLLPAGPQPKASSEQPNHLLIEMTDGIYTLPPLEAAAAGPAERTASAGSTSHLTRQLSLKAAQAAMPAKASVAQQQALFRWMLSNNSSVLGGLGEGEAGREGGSDDDSGSPSTSASGSEALEKFGEQLAVERGLRSFWTGIFFGGQGGPGSQQQQERMRSHAAAGTSSTQPTPATGPLAGGPERTYDAREFAAETRRTMALAAKLSDVRARRLRAWQRVQEAVEAQAEARQQKLKLHTAQQAAADAQKRADALKRAVELQQKQGASARQAALVRADGIVKAAEAAIAASSRLAAAEAALLGEEGVGRWRRLHAKLVGRQNRLVADLAASYQIGPTTGSPLDASPLAAKLDATWWSNSSDASLAAAEDEEPEPGPTADMAALVGAASTFVWPDGASDASSMAAGAVGNGRAGAAARRAAGSAARLLIFGLDVPPNLARRGLEGTMGWNGQYDEEQRVAAALGYTAHVVERLSVYLDVPLRFPLRPCSSRSTICDPAPLHHEAAEQHAVKKGWHLHSAIGGLTPLLPWHLGQPPGTSTHQQLAELPLYYDAGDRTRFAYAIFLLNKDIEQLLHVHGLASSGPNQLLQNLYKLISAAAAALPQPAVHEGGVMNGGAPAAAPARTVGLLLGPDDWHGSGRHGDASNASLPSLLQQGWLGSVAAKK